ncbi:uncharacterized protein LOC132735512 isoform X2 [Ruditapes philippinarum]|uniref:uncharacterized protein LOC132735512 isoform X2 n=1 Tax=Ruditapes philippinarum TaxID=129788 RepID=UPI00295A8F8F|nr:uncharacterized protein LOC132735512 isoform X2 [Ruditapes philippinarum]
MASYSSFICFVFVTLTISFVESTLDDDCNSQQAGVTCDSSQTTLYALVSNNCNSYCQCVPQSTQEDETTTYTWINMPCPAGLKFNNGAQYCDWPNNVSCS